MTVANSTLDKRLVAVGLTPEEMTLMRENGPFLAENMAGIIEAMWDRFDAWPEIHAALKDPALRRLHERHWQRVASGNFGQEFLNSADRLALVFYELQMPTHVFAICHAIVIAGITEALGVARDPSNSLLKRNETEVSRRRMMRGALQKAAWLDLEVLLETHSALIGLRQQAALDKLSECETRLCALLNTVAPGSGGTPYVTLTSASSTDFADRIGTAMTAISARVARAAQNVGIVGNPAPTASGALQSLSGAAQRIGDFAGLISDIAAKTNIVALDAAIGAATDSAAGRRHAEVSGEVKSLATQAARATEEIAQQVRAIQRATQDTVTAIRSVASVVAEMDRFAADAPDCSATTGTAMGQVLNLGQSLSRQAAELKTAAEKLIAQDHAA